MTKFEFLTRLLSLLEGVVQFDADPDAEVTLDDVERARLRFQAITDALGEGAPAEPPGPTALSL